ncbi:sigma-70 family RNA polymerase sigma factor [Corallococcus aberystwythensis]|uniref:Sigma-70 family RNA polymerase sigma factor n=2 Tax=Corallococcus aberystwythensis TaxID=2316722 RepID=A0A3A8QCU6_9BACT|nr:sigma-70 family RNA polymerase sigma factor [Corallococcus aberystwythensis]
MIAYGPELRRLMSAILRDETQAQEAFSLFAECLLKGLPEFRWESSFRTWSQRIARNVCFKLLNAPAARHRHVSLSAISAISAISAPRRSTTSPWRRSTVKDRFRALCQRLDPEQQKLLMLRVDQKLPWPEVVRAMSDSNESMTAEEQARRAAALRQQFQRLKAQLRTLAIEEGLIAL